MSSRGPTRARKWTCDQCGMSAGRIDGESTAMPSTWASSADGRYCLVCRRERAGSAGLESAPNESSVKVRANIRRTAMIEFEVARTPDQPDGTIARACHTSASTVAEARRRLQLPDPPPASAARRAKHREPAGR